MVMEDAFFMKPILEYNGSALVEAFKLTILTCSVLHFNKSSSKICLLKPNPLYNLVV